MQDDPTDEEPREEIQGLDKRQRAELVALRWVGRGDAEPEEWEQTVKTALALKEAPTPRHLLRHPMVGEAGRKALCTLGSKCRSDHPLNLKDALHFEPPSLTPRLWTR